MSGATVSKAEFATLCNTDPSRVSHWIKEGKIDGKAIVGKGRNARIDVEEAQRQLRIRMNSGQRLGNGLGTKLSRKPAPDPDPAERDIPQETGTSDPEDILEDALDAELKREKLVALQRANRRGAEEEAAAQGRYTETAAARRQMAVVAVQVLRVFEGAIPEMATTIAARFKAEEREVTLCLAELFRGVRAEASDKARSAAEKLDALVPDVAPSEG